MQHSLFEINNRNELVIGQSKVFDKDLNFTFSVPSGYTPDQRMPDLTTDQWIRKIKFDAARGIISETLAEKILISLDRLPERSEDQAVAISFSGKDAQVSTMIAIMKYGKKRMFAMMADTQDEWQVTLPFNRRWMKEYIGIPFYVLESVGIHKLLEELIPCWPMMRRRHCTKELKMIPQRNFLDEQGFDQIRNDGKPASFRPTYGLEDMARTEKKAAKAALKGQKAKRVDVRHPAPLMICGERHSEGEGRSELPVEPTRDDTMMRMVARPVVEFTIIEIWEFIFWMKSPYNPVYHLVKRVACAGCPFASVDEMYTLGEHHPEMLEAWVRTEEIMNHPRPGAKSFRQIYDELVAKGRLGIHADRTLVS